MSSFSERLKELIGGDRQKAAFARQVGLQESSIRQYLDGSLPRMDALVKIAEGTGASINWLATGEGPRDSSADLRHVLPGTQREHAEPQVVQSFDVEQLRENGFVVLPRLDVQASAGRGLINSAEDVRDFVAFDHAYLRAAGINPAQADLIQVEGRSMMPSFVDGEWVIVDRSATHIITGNIYAVMYQETLRIKRLRKERGAVVLVSDNKAEDYPDERIEGEDLADFRVVGRVRRHIRSV